MVRTAGRVVAVDAHRQVLLIRGHDPVIPDEPFWFTPGGGAEVDESPQQAAVRELAEETGIVVRAELLDGPLADEVEEFDFDAELRFRQRQVYFGLRMPAVDSAGVDSAGNGLTPDEQRVFEAVGWQDLDALVERGAVIYPPDLPEMVRRYLGAG